MSRIDWCDALNLLSLFRNLVLRRFTYDNTWHTAWRRVVWSPRFWVKCSNKICRQCPTKCLGASAGCRIKVTAHRQSRASWLHATGRTYIIISFTNRVISATLKKSWNRENCNNLISSDVPIFSPPPDTLPHWTGGTLEASPSNFWLRLKVF
jgi:hypothetical protein